MFFSCQCQCEVVLIFFLVLNQSCLNKKNTPGGAAVVTHVDLKGKLAHNSMMSYLVSISCLSHMVRTFITEKNAKIDVIHIDREKKFNFRNLYILGF